MRKKHSLVVTLWMMFVGAVAILPTLAQGCPALVQQALEAMGDNCGNMARNSACYGYQDVVASFEDTVPDDFFSLPADRADLTTLKTIQTAPLDPETETWGVAVMNVQGNVPNTLPGQAVTFVLLGDVIVENAVAPKDAQNLPPPITVTVRSGANVRGGAGTNFNVVGGANAGETFLADLRDESAGWVRIVYNNRLAWISRTVLQADPVIDNLPVTLDDIQTPMQAFYLRTGIGRAVCEEAPDSVLMIQGRKEVEIKLTLNGAEIVMGSTGLFRTTGDGTQLEVTTLDGFVQLTTPDGDTTTIPAGQKSVFCLSDEDNLGADGEANDRTVSCAGTPPETVPRDELADTWCKLRDVPAEVLNYNVSVPCEGDPTPTPIPTRAPATQAPRATATPARSGTTTGTLDCSGFVGVWPTYDAAYSNQEFTWTAVTGATRYSLDIFNNGRGYITTFFYNVTNSVLANVGDLLHGGSIYWRVNVLSEGGEILCSTPLSNEIFIRPKPTDTPTSNLTARWGCRTSGIYVEWSSAPAGSNITLSYTQDYYGNVTTFNSSIGSGESGSYFNNDIGDYKNGKISDGTKTVFLPDMTCNYTPG